MDILKAHATLQEQYKHKKVVYAFLISNRWFEVYTVKEGRVFFHNSVQDCHAVSKQLFTANKLIYEQHQQEAKVLVPLKEDLLPWN